MAPQWQQAVHDHGEGGAKRYVFGDCELDAARCELRCASQTVPVEPKVFNVLAFLIAHRARVVHKDELLERFWPGTFMSESALTHCLAKVRKAVHDDHVSQRIIKTVRGHGYRFVAVVTVHTSAPASLQRLPPSLLMSPSWHTSSGSPSRQTNCRHAPRKNRSGGCKLSVCRSFCSPPSSNHCAYL